MVSAERLRELFNYDPATGVFTRKVSAGGVRAGTIAGCKNADGYLVIRVDGALYYAHRLAWVYVHGTAPVHIDHVDTDKSNNRISNLREATPLQNNWNVGRNRRNTSGYKGVSFHRQSGKWVARIKLSGKYASLGLFSTPQEAHAAYIDAAYQRRGNFVRVV